MAYREVPDGVILDALGDDLARWHRGRWQRDVEDWRRIRARLVQRRVEVNQLRDGDCYLAAVAALDGAVAAGGGAPAVAAVPVAVPAPAGRVGYTHWRRFGPVYAGVGIAAVVVGLAAALVVSLVAAVSALGVWAGQHAGWLVGVPVLVVVLMLARAVLGGGGGRFSGTFEGRMRR